MTFRPHPKPEKRTKKPKQKIKPKSKKREREERIYSVERLIFLSENPKCQCGLDGCTGLSTEVHHKKGRRGRLLMDKRFWLAVCRNCHDYITEHSKQAIKLGFSLSINHRN